jgi:processing peptidase subunit beta
VPAKTSPPFRPSAPSRVSQAAVERERDVILREMEEVESQIEEVVFDRLHEVAYVGTPLARTILGPVENINSISADDIVKYVKTHYTAPRMVLAAAGAVDHDEVAKLAGDYFGGVPTVAPDGLQYENLPSLFTGADVREYNDDMPLAHFALAHEGLSWTHPDVFPLMLCQTLLGTVDKKNASGKFTASPLAKYLARDGLVESMQPFCAPRLPVRACTWSGWGSRGGEGPAVVGACVVGCQRSLPLPARRRHVLQRHRPLRRLLRGEHGG